MLVIEEIEFQVKLLHHFLGSNKSNINQLTKAQIKGYYLTQIKGQTLDILWVLSSVQNFHHRKFLHTVHDGNSATRWLHHTVDFFFLTTTTFKNLVYGQSSSYWQRLQVSSYRGFFYFNHEPYQPHRIINVGVSFQTTSMGTITYAHSPLTGVDSSRHAHGSESSPIVQGLVQDLNVYKTHGQ